MTAAHELSRADARRIAVRAQLLHRERPDDLHDLVRHLTMLQYDQTNAVAPSADVVAWSRIGSAFERAELAEAIEYRTLVDLHGMIRPREDVALYRADMLTWETRPVERDWEEERRHWVRANDACRRDILARLDVDGPLPQSAFPDTCAVPWGSSGWNSNRNVAMLLELMVSRGEVAVAGRDGRERLWDLASRVYPDDDVVPAEEARRIRAERRLRALGLARERAAETSAEPGDVGPIGEPAVVEGVRGRWRVDPAQLGQPFAGRAALLSPLDRLIFDRKRMTDLFEFDYNLEMYKPAARRRWGYWALPILVGDRLVGKLDATADRRRGVLRVDAVHEDAPFTRPQRAAVRAEIHDLAAWLGLALDVPAAWR